MDNTERHIIIVNPLDDTTDNDQPEFYGRDREEERSDRRFGQAKEIAVSELKESAHEFIENAKEIFDEIDVSLNRYQLRRVELTATVTTSGKLSWVVSSVEGGFEGGIKFVFERKADVE